MEWNEWWDIYYTTWNFLIYFDVFILDSILGSRRKIECRNLSNFTIELCEDEAVDAFGTNLILFVAEY